ncbi:hypothetical protein [Kitasatospora sp. NPDC050543]|uniref:hypothetical protein n=1 Tax=Kitasatospora sp. NPDC050543 TaxID=3364054 RepID=UPI0037AB08DF
MPMPTPLPTPGPEPAPGSDDETVRISDDGARTVPPGHVPAGLAPLAHVPPGWSASPGRPVPPDDDAMSATFLDPAAWSSDGPATTGPATTRPAETPRAAPGPPRRGPADRPWDAAPPSPPSDPAPGGEREVRRFGPGVPPQAAAAWRGTPARPGPRKRLRRTARWLVPAAVLLTLLAFLTRCHSERPLEVTGVTVSADPASGPSCGGTAVLTAAVTTNGNAGDLRYRWLRSDGTASGELVQPVRAGQRRVDLVLRWTFDGPGTMQATATTEIRAPQPHTAAASFTYTCRR